MAYGLLSYADEDQGPYGAYASDADKPRGILGYLPDDNAPPVLQSGMIAMPPAAAFPPPPSSLFPAMLPAAPVPYTNSGDYWGGNTSGAVPNAAAGPWPGSYLAPVPAAPDWGQVPTTPTANQAAIFAAPRPLSWNDVAANSSGDVWGTAQGNAGAAPSWPDRAGYPLVPPIGAVAPLQSGLTGLISPYLNPDVARVLRVSANLTPIGFPFALGKATAEQAIDRWNNWPSFDIGAFTGHVGEGREAVARQVEAAMPLALMGVGVPIPFAPKGSLGASGGRLPPAREPLPMRTAQRMERGDEMGYAPDQFWRGERSGVLPRKYMQAFFSRDKVYADDVAQAGGLPAAREFRLDLRNALRDNGPFTTAEYARIVSASDPKLAAGLVDMIMPGRDVKTFLEFARRNPDVSVGDGAGWHVRKIIERQAAIPERVFKDAGFNVLDMGRHVRNLDGYGIRLKSARFDPLQARSRNIGASVAAALGLGSLLAAGSGEPSEEPR